MDSDKQPDQTDIAARQAAEETCQRLKARIVECQARQELWRREEDSNKMLERMLYESFELQQARPDHRRAPQESAQDRLDAAERRQQSAEHQLEEYRSLHSNCEVTNRAAQSDDSTTDQPRSENDIFSRKEPSVSPNADLMNALKRFPQDGATAGPPKATFLRTLWERLRLLFAHKDHLPSYEEDSIQQQQKALKQQQKQKKQQQKQQQKQQRKRQRQLEREEWAERQLQKQQQRRFWEQSPEYQQYQQARRRDEQRQQAQ